MTPRLPRRLAFLDLETTGTDASRDRITEVGIVWMQDGTEAGEWSTLVNPGVAIPPAIQALTGIDNGMVRAAPAFESIAQELADRLQGCVLVAHNARFDYGFLKAGFRRLRRRFQSDVLCTVRLSRQLFPEYGSHGLDALVTRHRLGHEGRHRALGDARLIARLFDRLREEVGSDRLEQTLGRLLKLPARPPNLPENALDDIADSPGVYTFLGVNRQPLYIGKARNLRDRIRDHFHADSANTTDAQLATEIHDIEIEETPDEFCALVREVQLIRQRAPLHNIALRRKPSTCFLQFTEPGRKPAIVPLEAFDPRAGTELYGPFSSRQSARAALAAIAREHRLCDGAIGLWTGDRPCFSRQIGRCLGLCCDKEPADEHHRRLMAAVAPLRFPAWPFGRIVRYTATNPLTGLHRVLHFDHWCALDATSLAPMEFHPEVFKLLRSRLAKRPDAFYADISAAC
jgi:DNA polymerase-3 subunit epsilon